MSNTSFSESQIVNIKQQFYAMDRDRDGLITEAEFIQALKNSDRNPDDYEVQKFFSKADKNKDGKITFNEFLDACQTLGLGSSLPVSGKPADKDSKEVDAIFRNFDRDGDGLITAEELESVLKAQGENPSKSDIQDMLQSADKNKDNKVDREEFAKMI
ncbi:Calmodulin [Dissophora globulifera]|uniref:Calmodulin n=1 Tax=Dissophora globulifera TaxID=979702 RepID=A0A9P6RHJ5_9FUNG|nr:Calmodulin [Dissophora globulifera]